MGRHDWPGNVRELRNYVERAIVLKGALHEIGEPATRDQEPAANKPRAPFRVAKEEAIDDFERAYLTALLDEAAGNMSKAARLAAMDRMYLHKLVQKHGLRSSNGPPSGGIPGPGGLGDF